MTTRSFVVAITTEADGSATAYTPYCSGAVSSIRYAKGDFADGADFTITADATGETIWSESDVNASKACYPRAGVHSTAGVAALYAAGGTAVTDRIRLSRDRVKIVIAQGGNAKTGTFHVVVED